MNTGAKVGLTIGGVVIAVGLGYLGLKEYEKDECAKNGNTWTGDLLTGKCSSTVPVTQLAAPANVNATYNSTSTVGTITWDAVSGATTYKVTVNGNPVYSGSNLTATFTSTPGAQYAIDVTACP